MPHDKNHKPACSTVNASVPDEVACGECGSLVEMWSDEQEAQCPECGQNLYR